MNDLHPLVREHRQLAIETAERCSVHCRCEDCARLNAIERELTEALEYAALIGEIKAAVKAAEENHNG